MQLSVAQNIAFAGRLQSPFLGLTTFLQLFYQIPLCLQFSQNHGLHETNIILVIAGLQKNVQMNPSKGYGFN